MQPHAAADQLPGASGYVYDETLCAHVTIDEHGIVTGWNAGAETLLGYAPAQIVGRPVAGLLAEEIDKRELRSLAELPRWNGPIPLRHRDGHRLEVRVLSHKRAPDDGRPGEWFLVSTLTGPRPRPDDDALMSRNHEQVAGCAMAVYDTGLRLRRANEAQLRLLALTEDDARGLRAPEFMDHPEAARVERSMLRVLESGEPQVIEIYGSPPGYSREHAWSVFLTPLKDEDGRLGGVGTALHDVTEQYWARKRLVLLADASERVGSTLDVTRTAQELADVAVPEFADFVSVDLLPSLDGAPEPPPGTGAPSSGPVSLRRVAHRSVHEGTPEAVVAPGEVDDYPQGSPPVESFRSGRALLHHVSDPAITEWAAGDPDRASRLRDFGVHSAITVPLTARGTTLGVVVFVRHQHPEVFGGDDLVLAEELAARAAVCIDNARRYTRERATAVTLQRSLLPQALPVQAAVEVASRYLPAGARAGVGGDWFDVIPLSGARVALVVGDVVGHGIHASATMGRLRTAVLTLADMDLPPDELLTHLDDIVARLSTEEGEAPRSAPGAQTGPGPGAATTGDVGATCLYTVYDPVSRHCTIALAGHPAPFLVSPDGAARLLDLPVGPPLGLGGLPFEATEIELPEGSLLALYTDGLIESRERDIEAGESLLRQALAQPPASLDDLCDAVLAALLRGRPAADDIALLLARTKALDTDRVATWDIPADPVAVARARKEATSQLEAWGLEDTDFVTELVVSELVTNAIRYGDPPIHLRLIHDRNLICEVSDASGTAPHMRRARTYDEGGRGLLLVAQLTAAWGTRQTPHGKTIWAQQNLPVSPSITLDT